MKKASGLFGFARMTREERLEYFRSRFAVQSGFNSYFNGVGIAYRAAEYLFLFLFLIYLIVTALGNLGGISTANAEYMLRNFAMKARENRVSATEIRYSPDEEMSFALSGKGLSVCGNTGVTLFSATGRTTCRDEFGIYAPTVRASGKYSLFFENGGKNYWLYNSFSRVYTGVSETAVLEADVAENGNYAVLTEGTGSVSCVTVYDSDFEMINRYNFLSYAVAVDLNVTGDRVAIAVAEATEDGLFRARLLVCTVGRETADTERGYEGLFPLKTAFLDGGVALLCRDRLIVLSDDGTEAEYAFDGACPLRFSVSEDTAAVLLSADERDARKFRILTVNTAKKTAQADFTGEYCSMSSFGSRVFLLTDGGLSVFENGILSEEKDPGKPYSSDSGILAYSREGLYLTGRGAAYAIGVV